MPTDPQPSPPSRPDSVAKLEVASISLPRARTYTLLVTLLTAMLCGGAIGMNVVVNPRSEFSSDAYPPLVVDWVHQRVGLYEARAEPPRDLVVGASRSGFVPGLPGRENLTFQFFAAGSPPPDWLDFYRFAKSRQGAPENLIVVVDQSAFTGVFTPRVPHSAEAERIQGRPVAFGDHVAEALQSLSVSYVQDSLRSLRLRHITGYPPVQPLEANPVFARPDLMEAYRNGTFDPADVDPRIEDQSQRAFGPDRTSRPGYREALEEMIAEAVADGVVVWAVLPPYQPVALADLQTRFPSFEQDAQLVREALLAFCPGIHVADLTSVDGTGIDPRQFFDQSHLTPQGSAQLAQELANPARDLCAG